MALEMNHALAQTGFLASQHLQHNRVLEIRCLVGRIKPHLAVLFGELVIFLLIERAVEVDGRHVLAPGDPEA